MTPPAQPAPSAPPANGTRRYSIHFADGKSATVLDMVPDPPELLIPGLFAQFAAGYVVKVEPL